MNAVTDNGSTGLAYYRSMSFPLNIYAFLLQLEEGRADYLHYGLFKAGERSLQKAQAYSTELLLARLPAPPCRILEVGVGLGSTLQLLLDNGYHVEGITPDSSQIEAIRSRFGSDTPVACLRLEDYRTCDDERFDVILFQESAQYIDPLAIFNQALDLLRPGGSLLIIDEFALRRTEPGIEGLHLLNDILAQAARFQFELLEQLDLSALAAPTVDYLLAITNKHRQRLLNDLAVTTEQLDRLDRSNELYREKYANGRYGYALLHYRKTALPSWRLRYPEESDLDQLFTLFKHVFQSTVSPALWQWKYRSPQARSLCAFENGQMIGHYGGMPRDILFLGQSAQAVQIGDVMVEASRRGILTRQGPFFLMASTFLERFIGYGRPFLLGFGFPTARAMKVAERLGLYAEAGRMTELSWPPLSPLPHLLTHITTVDTDLCEVQQDAINGVWQAMSLDLQNAVIGVRDYRYLLDRYLSHPLRRYLVLAIKNRLNGRWRGIMVLHIDNRLCELVDIVAPLQDVGLLISHARRIAKLHRCDRLWCHISEAFADHLTTDDCEHKSLDVRIPACIWTEGPALDDFRDRWWLMTGDMDCR